MGCGIDREKGTISEEQKWTYIVSLQPCSNTVGRYWGQPLLP